MRLYRLQQRLSITTAEGNLLLGVGFLLLLGFLAKHVYQEPPALPEGIYEETDRAFEEASAPADPDSSDEQAAADPAAEAELTVAINTATTLELQQLPGIGPALAERIVAHREEYGPFARAEEVTAVQGIGPKTLEELQPHLVIEPDGE